MMIDGEVVNEKYVQKQIDAGEPFFARTTTIEEDWVKNSRKNFADFYFYINELPLAKHHMLWVKNILNKDLRRHNIIAPRESGKTTVMNCFLAWYIGKKPYTSNALICSGADSAKERLAAIKEVMASQRYMNVFPDVEFDRSRPNTSTLFSTCSRKWKNDEREINYKEWRNRIRYDKDLDSKSPTLFASSLSSNNIPGKRFSGLTITDDLHDEKNSRTEEQRTKVEILFKKTLLKCVMKNGKVVNICTRWAETDLSGRLKEDKRKRDNGLIWNTMETAAIGDDGQSYWPEQWPLWRLEEVRDDGETMFQLMYMNNPLGLSSGEITIDMLRNGLPDPLPKFKELVITVDIAKSLDDRADYTVFTLIGKGHIKRLEDGRSSGFPIYVLDIWRDKVLFLKCVDKLIEMYDFCCDTYGPVKVILFEKQGFQSAWGEVISSYRKDITIKNVSIPGDKEFRFKSFAAKAQGGKAFFNQEMKHFNAMCSECLAFPTGAHDDICDTLSLPFSHWGWSGNRKVGTTKTKSEYVH